jgi:16S rRNA (guanine527-N7)-methyltransferase
MQKVEIIQKYFSEFTEDQLRQLNALEHLYKEWNEKINVISRKDMDGLYEKHVLHSLSIAAVFDFKAATQIADLGCGGGFPSIPLAIFFPNVQFHLIDSIAKKLKVADAVAQSIGLKNITIEHSRIEDIKHKKFDFIVSRAVAPLKDLWKWSKPLLHTKHFTEPAPGLICLKGGDLSQEIFESNTRPHIISIYDFFVEDFFKEKYMVYIKK